MMKQINEKGGGHTVPNSQIRDSSSKIIFGDSHLCSQFLHGYVNIPILKNVEPEDIEDVSNRYVHMFTEKKFRRCEKGSIKRKRNFVLFNFSY